VAQRVTICYIGKCEQSCVGVVPAVSSPILVKLSPAEQAHLRRELRSHLRGRLLAGHIVLLLALGLPPSFVATLLFCSLRTVYRSRAHWLQRSGPFAPAAGDPAGPARPCPLPGTEQRRLRSWLKKAPAVFGWCRTRWSCATLALTWAQECGQQVSAETMRRWLQALDFRWKRTKPAAQDKDPERASKLARILLIWQSLGPREAMLWADELDLHLLPKSGYQWMEKGTQTEILTPGKNEKRYLAGAWDIRTGRVQHCIWYEKRAGLFVDLLSRLDQVYAARRYDQVYVVVDNYKIHKARKVEQWLAEHPRFELVFQPTYCPRSSPIERVFGDVHDQVTRNHRRKRIRDLVADVIRFLERHGPWRYQLSEIYEEPEVTAALRKLQRNKAA
jgi:transposase